MKKNKMKLFKFQFLLSVFLIVNLNSNAQIKIDSFKEAKTYFSNVFSEDSNLDSYGNVKIDMGTANSGRVKFRITDVIVRMEERKEEPGCADICPPRIIIHFDCRSNNCMSDPTMSCKFLYNSGSIVFYDLKLGKVMYEYFLELQNYFIDNLYRLKTDSTFIKK